MYAYIYIYIHTYNTTDPIAGTHICTYVDHSVTKAYYHLCADLNYPCLLTGAFNVMVTQ